MTINNCSNDDRPGLPTDDDFIFYDVETPAHFDADDQYADAIYDGIQSRL